MERPPAPLVAELLPGLPLFAPGMDLAREIARAAMAHGMAIGPSDVVVIAQKIVSKVEGRLVELTRVEPGADAIELARQTGRPAPLAELILAESAEVMRATRAAVVTRHRTGHVTANAGIDASNVAPSNQPDADAGTVLLWPEDPDASAGRIRAQLQAHLGAAPAVIIADSLGRAWRQGTLGTAIGVAGLVPTDDRRGQRDLHGRTLQATVVAVADALAAMAVLAMGEGAEGTPVAVLRGAGRWITAEDGPGATAILRPLVGDLFR